jgi:hypothetical protein
MFSIMTADYRQAIRSGNPARACTAMRGIQRDRHATGKHFSHNGPVGRLRISLPSKRS